ncbi:sulfurtransferase complex subunit TusC [Actinobacillus equuli]|uniref:sulfurtransferase complex subunit TusC n=1 Tax=Actinobacillus equuli TaxID=718 RepID=UPI0024430110|nr:sulfurtransferase complex subunit TusC [Actinobacillus equuli]WGE83167.1 sulfurtransferase complex subunit TusC [Actinobacillus equuli subsp. equuli]WGE85218.1 sulfurtransferase complex subunit TusC [Actinobacillus equuli subsp. haemolyticus]
MMKKYKLAFLFTQPPFGTATSREGLDALLAASAFCAEDEIAICFLNDGVFNLLTQQQPNIILQKDHISTFKLIDLYDLTECFICEESINQRALSNAEWILPNANIIPQTELFAIFAQAEKVLTF